LATISAVVASLGALVTVPATPAAAYPYANVTVNGHGWGHGMGMGQWGALGYAVAGTGYQQILQHYYGSLASGGSTSVGAMPNGWTDSTPVVVSITANAGNDVIVTSDSPFTVPGPNATTVQLPGGSGARFQLASPGTANTWNVYTSTGGCGGNGNWGAPEATGVVGPTATPVTAAAFPADANVAHEVLQLCEAGGNLSVRGSLGGTVNSNDAARTVNTLALGLYVAGVTPSESPAYWGTLQPTVNGQAGPQGQAWGFQALEAQAVAARSYVMSTYGSLQGYFGYADICDSTACQAYAGIGNENALTDTATTDTAGVAVLMPNGSVATTQYSSSTGGYTAPGTFAAVPDDGDAVCLSNACNSHHAWQATVPVSAVQAAFPQIGTLTSLTVTARNGLGDYGGRVSQMTISGTSGSVNITGNTFAADFSGYGVQSNWFSIASQPSGGVTGYWVVGSDGGLFSYGAATYYGSMGGSPLVQPVVAMAATTDQKGYFMVASDGGIFAFGDAAFAGSMGGKHLNQPMVGMAVDPAGSGGYWTVASDGGIFAFGGAPFLGSTGNIVLDRPVVTMASTGDGRGYYMAASDGGMFAYGDATFHGSLPGLGVHVTNVVGMAPTPDNGGYWLVASDGGVFAFGDASFEGSLPGRGITATATAILPTKTGAGYLIVTADGQVVPFGDAPQFGQPKTSSPTHPLVGGATVTG
jgi:SpoIID/LytB domain protein